MNTLYPFFPFKNPVPCIFSACIIWVAAGGKESFYEKLGFERRPTENRGAGMMKMVGREEK